MHMLVVIVVIASAKLKLSQLLERGGIYRIEWRLAKLKLSNELECGGIYGMMYDTNKHRYTVYIHINIVEDAIWPVWGSLRLAPNNSR